MGVSEGWGCRGTVPGASQWGGGSVGHRGAPTPVDEGEGFPPSAIGLGDAGFGVQSAQSVGMGVLHGGSAWGGFRGARKGKQEGGSEWPRGGRWATPGAGVAWCRWQKCGVLLVISAPQCPGCEPGTGALWGERAALRRHRGTRRGGTFPGSRLRDRSSLARGDIDHAAEPAEVCGAAAPCPAPRQPFLPERGGWEPAGLTGLATRLRVPACSAVPRPGFIPVLIPAAGGRRGVGLGTRGRGRVLAVP